MRHSCIQGLGRPLVLAATAFFLVGPAPSAAQPASGTGKTNKARPAPNASDEGATSAAPSRARDTAPPVEAARPAEAAPVEDEAPRARDEKSREGDADVTIDLRPSAILEGHDLRATVKVQPDSMNRLLAVRIDAPTFYASTERELMGASSPRTYTFKWEKLPAGIYRVEAIVTDATGRLTRVHREFQVHGGTLDGELMAPTPRVGRRGRRR